MSKRTLAIDPGTRRIGIAISDPTGTIARTYCVIPHVSLQKNAEEIVSIASQVDAGLILIGQALNSEGETGPQARKSIRLASAIQGITKTPLILWDESGSTRAAWQTRKDTGKSLKKRRGHLDDVAAAIILQDYLDHCHSKIEDEPKTGQASNVD